MTVGKELRLKQQYFWTAASLADILRRFKNLEKPITELPDCELVGSNVSQSTQQLSDVAIQLNDVSALSGTVLQFCFNSLRRLTPHWLSLN